MTFTDVFLTFIFEKFYKKEIDLKNLKILKPIFEVNFKKLNDPIIAEIKKGDFTEIFTKKSQNIGRFSAAKTFQQAKDLTDLVISDKGYLPFEEFKKFASEVVEKYNVTWLETEYNDVKANSQMARSFLEAEQSGVEYLQYSAINDGVTRADHAAMDGIILPINHSFWKTHTPPNGFNCRCEVVPYSEFEDDFKITSAKSLSEKTKEINQEFAKNPEFAYNPARVDWVYKENGSGKHNYFKIPKEFKEAQKNNFNL
jgi:SPP1 gp7 family putative phage head morphogenesis protein